MRDDEREVQLFFAGSGQDFRRVGYGGSEHFGRLRTHCLGGRRRLAETPDLSKL